jgi:aspartate aminotransferase
VDTAAIERAITERTVAVLINSPNNPTGAVYDAASLARIAALCRQHHLWLVSDEAYAFFVYDQEGFFSPYELKDIRSQLIVVRSFSKTYAMTGFRIGYVAAPEAVIARLNTLQGHLSGNVCSFAQEGALRALRVDRGILEARRAAFRDRRDRAVAQCKDLFDVIEPSGAFYLFPGTARYRDRYGSDEALARHILENANVAVVPGVFFGAPDHIRLSFAARADHFAEGMKRIRGVL